MDFDDLKREFPDLIPADFTFECGPGWIQPIHGFFTTVHQWLPRYTRLVDVRRFCRADSCPDMTGPCCRSRRSSAASDSTTRSATPSSTKLAKPLPQMKSWLKLAQCIPANCVASPVCCAVAAGCGRFATSTLRRRRRQSLEHGSRASTAAKPATGLGTCTIRRRTVWFRAILRNAMTMTETPRPTDELLAHKDALGVLMRSCRVAGLAYVTGPTACFLDAAGMPLRIAVARKLTSYSDTDNFRSGIGELLGCPVEVVDLGEHVDAREETLRPELDLFLVRLDEWYLQSQSA